MIELRILPRARAKIKNGEKKQRYVVYLPCQVPDGSGSMAVNLDSHLTVAAGTGNFEILSQVIDDDYHLGAQVSGSGLAGCSHATGCGRQYHGAARCVLCALPRASHAVLPAELLKKEFNWIFEEARGAGVLFHGLHRYLRAGEIRRD